MTITLTLAPKWDADLLQFLHQAVTDRDHPFVTLTVEPGGTALSLTSSLAAVSGLQLRYCWPLLDNPATDVRHYKVKALGLAKILKLLRHDQPVAMTIRQGMIYLQSSEFADLLGDFSPAHDSVEYWLEVVAKELSREFDMLGAGNGPMANLAAADLGRHLNVAVKYMKLSPLNTSSRPRIQLYFTAGQVSVQAQAAGDVVALSQPWRASRSLPAPFVPATLAMTCELAAKVASLLILCAGEVAVTFSANTLLMERPGWSLSVRLAQAQWNSDHLEQRLRAVFATMRCELPVAALVTALPKVAIADHIEKERLHMMTHDQTHPNGSDEFMVRMNQDHVGAALTVKAAHPFTPALDVCCNFACLQHVLTTLPLPSQWAFLSPHRTLLFCDESETVRFAMACMAPSPHH